MHNYYNTEKLTKTYNEKYRVLKVKRKLRLTQIEVDGYIDENTRKKLIKRLYKGEN